MTEAKGFTLIELVVVLVVIATITLVAVPRYLSLSTDARIANLGYLEVQVEEAVRNVQVLRNIDGREFEIGNTTYVSYTKELDLKLKKEQLDIWEMCRAIGLIDVTLSSSIKRVETEDGRYQCYSENAQSLRVIDLEVTDNSCYLLIRSNNHNSEPSTSIVCG